MSRLSDAFDTLIMARVWLKCSYIYAYYLPDNDIGIELFRKQQAMIEHFTELLGELLFKSVETYDPDVICAKASSLNTTLNNFASSTFTKK